MAETPVTTEPADPTGSNDDGRTDPTAPTGSRDDAPVERTSRRRVDKTLVIASLVIGLGLALVTRGLFIGVSGDDRTELPPTIERVDPVPEATQVLSQSSVFVDLEAGHTGVLIIDGVEIDNVDMSDFANAAGEPGVQIEIPPGTVYEPGNATLTFTPGDGAPITEFDDGEHRATVLYWPVDETRERARTFTWTFTVV